MATAAPYTPPPPRHALGLPAGSVRALLALSVLGLLWTIALNPKRQATLPLDFLYLLVLMVLIPAHYFAAHGSTIGRNVSGGSSALGLPSGSVRFILLAGFL